MKRPSAPTEVTDIRFERADKGLGLSIAGGLGSTPYKDNDEGIFISRVTAGGPAAIAGNFLLIKPNKDKDPVS